MEKVRICTEWDMAWFCDGCGKMLSWKQKGYIKNEYKLCEDCKDKSNNQIKKKQLKGSY